MYNQPPFQNLKSNNNKKNQTTQMTKPENHTTQVAKTARDRHHPDAQKPSAQETTQRNTDAPLNSTHSRMKEHKRLCSESEIRRDG
eukprot:c16905_g1_i1 orf=197-454(+)